MLFKLKQEREKVEFQPFSKWQASGLNVKEKDVENWLSEHPGLLFGDERIIVISQSIPGGAMADILALDAAGKLVIVEIKRDWSNRKTIGQLLEYAASMAEITYRQLEELHQKYLSRHHQKSEYIPLLERFKQLAEEDETAEEDIPKGHRVCIVAPGFDRGLMRIIEWLQTHGVPINFVPFTLYADRDGTEIFLEIEPLPKDNIDEESFVGNWQGDWLFNTNEANVTGAYSKMFAQNVIAIFGYDPVDLRRGRAGQRVFAYVNRKGVLGVGELVDGDVFSSNTVFDKDLEFHARINWTTVVDENLGVKKSEVTRATKYNLPVRGSPFCRLRHSDAANWIADELQRRTGPE